MHGVNEHGACRRDTCFASHAAAAALAQYGQMRDALNATGYPVWFALCGPSA